MIHYIFTEDTQSRLVSFKLSRDFDKMRTKNFQLLKHFVWIIEFYFERFVTKIPKNELSVKVLEICGWIVLKKICDILYLKKYFHMWRIFFRLYFKYIDLPIRMVIYSVIIWSLFSQCKVRPDQHTRPDQTNTQGQTRQTHKARPDQHTRPDQTNTQGQTRPAHKARPDQHERPDQLTRPNQTSTQGQTRQTHKARPDKHTRSDQTSTQGQTRPTQKAGPTHKARPNQHKKPDKHTNQTKKSSIIKGTRSAYKW